MSALDKVLIPAVSRGVWHSLVLLLWSFGMLPVSGPILRPRPLGCSVALIIGAVAFFFCSPMLYYSQYKLTVSMEGLLGVLWIVRDATNRLSIILRRDALCEWVHCMSLYCLRHPPSPRAWRRLLLVALLFSVGWLGCIFSSVHWVLNSPIYAESGKTRTLFRAVTGVYPVVLEIYLLLFVGPVALTMVLTADLGRECAVGPTQVVLHQHERPSKIMESTSILEGRNGNQRKLMDEAGGPKRPSSQERQSGETGSAKGSETNDFWRWARCRQRVLHDLACTANSHVSAMIPTFVVLHFYHSAFACSHTIISAINEPNLHWNFVVPVVHIICRNILFILLCWVAQRANGEMEFLVFNVQTHRKRFNILGLFLLDLTFMKTVLGAILTYIVVLYQFGASFSSNKS